jgi:RNA polymerase sigma-70 factor (ECF subfamily)
MPAEIADALIALLPRLRRYALVLARSDDVADDLVQAACERALAAANGPADGAPIDAWLLRIVRNLWIDRGRRRRSEGTALDVDDHFDEIAALDCAPDTAEVADSRRRLARVRVAIDALPEDQREVLLLVCAEGLSYREAAEMIGVPIGTVMSRLARARAKLAALSEPDAANAGIGETAARLGDVARRRPAAALRSPPDSEP